MNNFIKYAIGCLIGIFVGAVWVLWYQLIERQCEKINGEIASVVWRQEHFILSPENLFNELKAQDIKFPEIVLAQALLETDYFKSYSCKKNNNLFGFLDKNGVYVKFDHWSDCVATYKSFVQNWKRCPQNYYEYLNIYTEDSLYNFKLKQIVNSWSSR